MDTVGILTDSPSAGADKRQGLEKQERRERQEDQRCSSASATAMRRKEGAHSGRRVSETKSNDVEEDEDEGQDKNKQLVQEKRIPT